MLQDTFLAVENLRVVYKKGERRIVAVNNVSFAIEHPGQALAIVGESGCGKTTLAAALQRLLPRDAELSGRVLFDGEDLLSMTEKELERRVRWKKMSWVPQGTANSLNDFFTIGNLTREVLSVHGAKSDEEEVFRLLESVGLSPGDARSHPFELSGGMKQRACIAHAISRHPKLILLDEPTSALDVSIQGSIINLLASLKRDYGCSYIFITHDITLAKGLCDFFAVMYAGRIVEMGSTEQILYNPLHPYTQALLDCIPTLEPGKEIHFIPGEPPNLSLPEVSVGCPFRFRSAVACENCSEVAPALDDKGEGHLVACHSVPRKER